jgi:hypothetical protein
MRSLVIVVALTLLLAVLMAGTGLAEYVCEYSNSEVTGNDATNRIVGIAVLSEDNFVMSINRESVPIYALCKWTDATATTGRGNDVLQWFYNFDTVNLENPFGIGVDGNGNIYLANNDPNHNILVFDANGADPVASAYRLETTTDDTLYAIDVDTDGHVFVCYSNADQDRVDIYPSITDDMWTTHTGSPAASVPLPDGLYYGMCVNDAGTEIYVSEYNSSIITRYTGSVSGGYTLDSGFSVQVDSLATAIDVDNQGYLYVVSDHASAMLFENPAGYSWFWVVNLATGVVTDKVDMYSPNGGQASETSAGYHSATDIEVDEAGNVYVVHYYAWAVEKWVGSPSTAVENAEATGEMPRTSALVQNYPNPFNASTEIRYRLPQDARVRLDVFNVAGQLVERLVDREQAAGDHLINWNAGNLPSGIYLLRLQAGQETALSKMVLVR